MCSSILNASSRKSDDEHPEIGTGTKSLRANSVPEFPMKTTPGKIFLRQIVTRARARWQRSTVSAQYSKIVGSWRSRGFVVLPCLPVRLSERVDNVYTLLPNLTEFRDWARSLAKREVTRFDASDGSPNLQTLYRELEWLIEDSLMPSVGLDEDLKAFTQTVIAEEGRCVPSVALRLPITELKDLWSKRIYNRVPLQYLTNTAHWRDIQLTVSSSVLIPRPETELLIDFAREVLDQLGSQRDHHASFDTLLSSPWLDLGTGSGAIAISLAQELKRHGGQRVIAVDKSVKAVEVAKHNIQRYGLQDKVEVLIGSWFEPIDTQMRFAGILTNPPYIPSELLGSLQSEVQLHEPWLALDGGKGDGELHILSICGKVAEFLLPGGLFAIETHDFEQSRLVERLLKGTGSFCDIRIRQDYSGVSRFVTARRGTVSGATCTSVLAHEHVC